MSARLLRLTLAAAALCCACQMTPPTAPALAGDEQPESAADLKTKIVAATEKGTAQSLNEAMAVLKRLDEQTKDPAAREAVGFEELKAKTVLARDTFFRKAVQIGVYKTMGKLIDAKAREKKPAPPVVADPAKGPAPGTLAAARQWLTRDLPKLLWDGVGADLGLTAEEVERFWKERSGKTVLTASYGAGSFIVVKRPEGLERHKDPNKPKTEPEWWDLLADRPMDRAKWLTAYFVESSGFFEIVRTDESEACGACGGRGVNVSINTDGTQTNVICPVCNGAAKVKKVLYR